VLAEPMVITLYQYGAFTVDDVLPTTRSVRALAIGLLAFMAVKVLASAYFAKQDTKTPVRIAVIAMVSNTVMVLMFIYPLKHVGLALATALAAFLNAGLLLRGLLLQKILVLAADFYAVTLKITLASIAMVVVIYSLQQTGGTWLAWSVWGRVAYLLLLCGVGFIVYISVLGLLGLRPQHFRA
jgi:putative peptidoglycan lipid II flippase